MRFDFRGSIAKLYVGEGWLWLGSFNSPCFFRVGEITRFDLRGSVVKWWGEEWLWLTSFNSPCLYRVREITKFDFQGSVAKLNPKNQDLNINGFPMTGLILFLTAGERRQ